MSMILSDAILGLSLTKFLLHLLNFAILFVALWLILYKPVMKFIQERQARIEKQKTEAEENLRAAEEAKQAEEEKLRTLDDELEQKRKDAERDLALQMEETLRETQQKAALIIKEAERLAAERAEKVKQAAREEIKDAAVLLAENIIETKIDDVSDALIDGALKDWKND